MISILSNAADVALFPLFETDVSSKKIVDEYSFEGSASPVVPVTPSYNAYEVIAIRVVLDQEEDGGDYDVDVTMWGYPLTRKMTRSASKGHGVVYGDRDEEVRFELARKAVLVTLEKHNLQVGQLNTSLPTWVEHQERIAARHRATAERIAAEHLAKQRALATVEIPVQK